MWFFYLILFIASAQAQTTPSESVPAVDHTIKTCDDLIKAKEEVVEQSASLHQRDPKTLTKNDYAIAKKSAERLQVLNVTQKELFASNTLDETCKEKLNAAETKWRTSMAEAAGVPETDQKTREVNDAMNYIGNLNACASVCKKTHGQNEQPLNSCLKSCVEAVEKKLAK